MSKEQYVTFDVAKLLKEKGFDWKTDFVWYEHLPLSLDWRNKANQKAMDYFYFNETTEHHSCYRNCDKKPSYINGDIYSAPTQQMACRWLREVHNIHIMPTIGCDVDRTPRIFYGAVIASFNKNGDICYHNPLDENGYNEPEDAVEAALEYSLKNLI